jgi:hypothetical protein
VLRCGLTSTSSETCQSEINTWQTGEDASHQKILIEGAVQPPFAFENRSSGHHVSIVESPVKTGKRY